MMATFSPDPGTLLALRGKPYSSGMAGSQCYLLSGDAAAGPIKSIIPEEGVELPQRSPALSGGDFFLCIYHFNDLHGHLARFTPMGEEPVFSRMVGRIKSTRRKYADSPNKAVLTFGAGDDSIGSIFDELLDSELQEDPVHASYQLYSKVGIDAVALGNHDFDMGSQLLAEVIRRDAKFPILAANIVGCEVLKGLCYPAAIFEVKGLRVGVIGVVTPAEFNCHDAPCRVVDPIPVVNNLVPALRPHCDVLIVLSHLGYNLQAGSALTKDAGDVELAESLPPGSVDLIIGGHTHNVLNSQGLSHNNIVNGIPIVQAGALGRYLGQVDITIQNQVPSVSNVRLLPTDSLPVDKEFEEQGMQPMIGRVRRLFSREIGRVADDPNLSTDMVRNTFASRELALANYITDAMVERLRAGGHKVDFAMIDSSNIRRGLPPGEALALGDWFNLMPFTDTVRYYQLTGQQVKTLLEDNAFRIDYPGEPHTERGFLQFSRQLRYMIVRGETRGKAQMCEAQVEGVSLDDQLDRTFVVAGTSFLRGLADQWQKKYKQQYALVDLEALTSFESDIFLRKELVTYIQEHGGVTQEGGAHLDGRLRMVESCNAPVSTQTVMQFINEVSNQNHAMAGAVTALSAAQGAALGLACLRITKDLDASTGADADTRIHEIIAIKSELMQWCQQDADAIAEFAALRDAGKEQTGKRLLCQAPASVCRITLQAAEALQGFRPLVHERVRDDMEMSIALLAGAAQSALLLLDSNLRIWPEKELLNEFEPMLAELLRKMELLSPVERLR